MRIVKEDTVFLYQVDDILDFLDSDVDIYFYKNEFYIKIADYVIYNDKDVEKLEVSFKKILEEIWRGICICFKKNCANIIILIMMPPTYIWAGIRGNVPLSGPQGLCRTDILKR